MGRYVGDNPEMSTTHGALNRNGRGCRPFWRPRRSQIGTGAEIRTLNFRSWWHSGLPKPDSWRSLRQAGYPQLLHQVMGRDPGELVSLGVHEVAGKKEGLEVFTLPEFVTVDHPAAE